MRYKLIKLEGNKSVLVEEKLFATKGDWNYEVDNSIPIYQFDYDLNPYPINKIIATINHSISLDVPMILVEDEVEKLANELIEEAFGESAQIMSDAKSLCKDFYVEGFKAAQQKGVYSEQDLKTAFEVGRNYQLTGENNFKEFIQSLNQEYIELEMESDTTEIDSCRKFNIEIGCTLDKCKCADSTLLRIKTNRVNGQLMAYVK